MKPDLHNNTNIKQVFEDREISPSANSWNKLASLLDEQLPVPEQQISIVNKSKTRYKYFLSIAAVLVCICGFTFWTLNNSNDIQLINEVDETIVQLDSPTQIKSTKSNKENKYQAVEINEKNQVKKTTNAKLVETKLASLIPDFIVVETETESKKTDTILPTVIVKSSDKIHIAWDNKESEQINVNPNNLLRNVERELINEHVETELNKPRDRFEQIRMALSNRNYEE